MSINADRLVSITPSVLSGGSSDLETNGLLLTKSDLIPTSTLALVFTDSDSVSDYFGAESDEADFASQYFSGVTNAQKSVDTLVIGRRIAEDAAAWVRSGALKATLAELKAVTDGALSITVNGNEKTVSGLDLSSAATLSEVAELLADAVGDVTGSYDSNTGKITLTTSTVGADASVSCAEAPAEGTDLAELLRLSEAEGAVVSEGTDAMTAAENLEAITGFSRNWVGFTTAYAADVDEADALSAWADEKDDYVYFDWDLDENLLDQETQSSTKAVALAEKNYACTACIYGDVQDAALFLAVGASIKWTAEQGIKAWFAKIASGIAARVTSNAEAEALESINVNYVGEFATRNAEFDFINRGALIGGTYGFIDTLYGMIWLKAKIQRSFMDGFAAVNRAPYTPSGYAFIEAWLMDPITAAKKCGVIDTGLELSASQVQQLLSETGNTNIESDLYSKGYWYKISDPEANVRAERGSPELGLWITYGGSVQSIELPVKCAI